MCCSGRRSLSQNIIKGFVLVLSVFVTMDRQKIGAAGSTRATASPQPPSRPRRPPKPSGTIGRSRTRSPGFSTSCSRKTRPASERTRRKEHGRGLPFRHQPRPTYRDHAARANWLRTAAQELSPATARQHQAPPQDGRMGQRHTHQNPARLNLELAPTASTPAIVGAGWAARMAITVSRAICARRPCTTAAPELNFGTKAG